MPFVSTQTQMIMSILITDKPDGNVEFTLHPGSVLDVLEDVDWLLAVAVDVDRTPVHLRQRLTDLNLYGQNYYCDESSHAASH